MPKASVFPDRVVAGAWRVEFIAHNGEDLDMALFEGPNARKHSIAFASQVYKEFDERFDLHPLTEPEFYDFLFDDPSGGQNQDLRLVGTQDDAGRPVDIGEWKRRTDGHMVLRVDRYTVKGPRLRSQLVGSMVQPDGKIEP